MNQNKKKILFKKVFFSSNFKPPQEAFLNIEENKTFQGYLRTK